MNEMCATLYCRPVVPSIVQNPGFMKCGSTLQLPSREEGRGGGGGGDTPLPTGGIFTHTSNFED